MSNTHVHRHIAAGAGARHAYELNHQRIAGLWAQAQPVVTGDAADLYLRGNGAVPLVPLVPGAWPASLRLHPALDYWQVARNGIAVREGQFPALLVLLQIDVFPHGVHRPAVQHAVALQRIYLTADGALAPVASPIKLTGAAGPAQGAAAQLALFTADANGWGVAVGVCAALRIGRATRMPVWAVPDAAALAHVRWPRGARSAHLFIDPREHAQWQPAAELARKASACGLDVYPMAVQLEHANGTPQFPQITATRL